MKQRPLADGKRRCSRAIEQRRPRLAMVMVRAAEWTAERLDATLEVSREALKWYNRFFVRQTMKSVLKLTA